MTVRRLRQEIDLVEMVDWQGYWRYRAALEDQARQRIEMERQAKRRTPKMRKR